MEEILSCLMVNQWGTMNFEMYKNCQVLKQSPSFFMIEDPAIGEVRVWILLCRFVFFCKYLLIHLIFVFLSPCADFLLCYPLFLPPSLSVSLPFCCSCYLFSVERIDFGLSCIPEMWYEKIEDFLSCTVCLCWYVVISFFKLDERIRVHLQFKDLLYDSMILATWKMHSILLCLSISASMWAILLSFFCCALVYAGQGHRSLCFLLFVPFSVKFDVGSTIFLFFSFFFYLILNWIDDLLSANTSSSNPSSDAISSCSCVLWFIWAQSVDDWY